MLKTADQLNVDSTAAQSLSWENFMSLIEAHTCSTCVRQAGYWRASAAGDEQGAKYAWQAF